MSWYLDTDNRLNHADLAKEGGNSFVYPYPYTFWDYISDTDKTLTLNHGEFKPMRYAIVNEEENRNDNQSLFPPYPASFWYMDSNNKLSMVLLPKELPLGAFAGCKKLTEVILPESLTSIGRESFAESGLRSVIIPNNECTYYSTSFPENCVVTGGHLIV